MPKTPFELACEYITDEMAGQCPGECDLDVSMIRCGYDCDHPDGTAVVCWKLYFEKQAKEQEE